MNKTNSQIGTYQNKWANGSSPEPEPAAARKSPVIEVIYGAKIGCSVIGSILSNCAAVGREDPRPPPP